jgi:hypothetical protein
MEESVRLLAPVTLFLGKEPPAYIWHEMGWHQICAKEEVLFSRHGTELCFIHRLAVTYSLCGDLHGKCVVVVIDFMVALRYILSSSF